MTLNCDKHIVDIQLHRRYSRGGHCLRVSVVASWYSPCVFFCKIIYINIIIVVGGNVSVGSASARR